MLEFVEEAFDEIAIAVEERAEGRDAFSVWHGFDAGPCAACRQSSAHGIAVVGAVSKQDAAFTKTVEHVIGGPAVVGLVRLFAGGALRRIALEKLAYRYRSISSRAPAGLF